MLRRAPRTKAAAPRPLRSQPRSPPKGRQEERLSLALRASRAVDHTPQDLRGRPFALWPEGQAQWLCGQTSRHHKERPCRNEPPHHGERTRQNTQGSRNEHRAEEKSQPPAVGCDKRPTHSQADNRPRSSVPGSNRAVQSPGMHRAQDDSSLGP